MGRVPSQEGGGFQKIDAAGRIVVPSFFREALVGKVIYLLPYNEANGAYPRIFLFTEESHATLLKNLQANLADVSDIALKSFIVRIWMYAQICSEVREMDPMGRVTISKPLLEAARIRNWYKITGNPLESVLTVWAKEVYQELYASLRIEESVIPGIPTSTILSMLGIIPNQKVNQREAQ